MPIMAFAFEDNEMYPIFFC